MVTKSIDLYDYFKISKPNGANGKLDIYIQKECTFSDDRLRPAMLVLPGGGYTHLSDREAEPIALRYLANGFNAFVLYYSVSPSAYPTQFIEGAMALAYIRLNAKEFSVCPEHVCAVGFSAGGHLAGTLATKFEDDLIFNALGENASLVRPDAVILSYPVIASNKPYSHEGSFEVLAGKDFFLKEQLSLENAVNKNSSPAFIWHTQEDACVPVENSLQMVLAYRKNGVPFEYHVFEKGGHGEALGTLETLYDNPSVAQWVDLSLTWLKSRGFKIKD